jgi:hypothetical protein
MVFSCELCIDCEPCLWITCSLLFGFHGPRSMRRVQAYNKLKLGDFDVHHNQKTNKKINLSRIFIFGVLSYYRPIMTHKSFSMRFRVLVVRVMTRIDNCIESRKAGGE